MDYEKILSSWKSPLVARTKIEEFTQGAYKANSFSVFDCQNKGVKPRFRLGKKVFYFTSDVIAWIQNKKRKGE